jgi:hypothetical protein
VRTPSPDERSDRAATNGRETREEWLGRAIELMRPEFEAAGAPLPVPDHPPAGRSAEEAIHPDAQGRVLGVRIHDPADQEVGGPGAPKLPD